MNRKAIFLAVAVFLFLAPFTFAADPQASTKSVPEMQPGQSAPQEKPAEPPKDRKWDEYSRDRHGVVYSYEKDTIVFGKGTIKVWRKREFPIRARQRAILNLDEIDCWKQRHRTLEVVVVGWNDSSESFKRETEWSTIYSDSPEEFFLDTTCKEFRKNKK